MNFKVNTIREFAVEHMFEGVDNIVKFHFKKVAVEDTDFDELRKKLNSRDTIFLTDEQIKVLVKEKNENLIKENKTKMSDEETKDFVESIKEKKGTYNAFLYTLRKSLVGWEGIVDQNNNIVVFNENNQLAIFEEIQKNITLIQKIMIAYMGVDEKNLQFGAMQQ